MTEPTAATGKVAQLTPEEWKQLVLLNTQQLLQYLQTVPGNTEGGASGLTEQHLALVDGHIARGRTFMRAWSLAKITVAAEAPAPAEQATAPQQGNGATDPAPKKGGWPKGRRRKPASPEVPQS